MLTVLSLVTSIKDYIEIAHKLIESQSGNPQTFLYGAESVLNQKETGIFFKDYTEFGAVLTYLVLSIKGFLTSFFSFAWLNQIWSLPLIVPDIASAMISEVSVLDSYFTNAFSFLETGLSTSGLNSTAASGSGNTFIYAFEKFVTGFFNSLFFVLPTSTAHLITVRRFVIQGLEAGYIAGLGTIAGNVLWLASIILGWRFIVIPWLSFDIFRYILGFSLLVKYLWDSSKEFNKTNQTVLEDNTKKNIFVLNFLLALTEQTSIYPFISNISFGPEGSMLESFSGPIFQSYSQNAHSLEFLAIHGCYLLGIILGCFSLLQFSVWFWENPAFSIYMWMITSYRVTTSSYYKVLNFIFLYLTMLCAISSIPYFGLDYTVTNPLGLIPQDRIIDQKFTTANGPSDKILQETAFLGVNPTDKNTRIRDGIHARRERWKERLIKYQAFDASVYDQGNYDILTIEDLNYGFDRFWLRRKMRNHQIRFRLFPGPWMRSLKKQLNKPGFSGPRVEFFRILFEQYYHPIFHATANKKTSALTTPTNKQIPGRPSLTLADTNTDGSYATRANQQAAFNSSIYAPILTDSSGANKYHLQKGMVGVLPNISTMGTAVGGKSIQTQNSTLRKFSRNFNNRLNRSEVLQKTKQNNVSTKPIYSKSLKNLLLRNTITKDYTKEKINLFRNISKNLLLNQNSLAKTDIFPAGIMGQNVAWAKNNNLKRVTIKESLKKTNIRKKLSKKERLLLTLKMDFYKNLNNPSAILPSIGGAKLNTTANIVPRLNGSNNLQQSTPTSILGRPFGSSLEPLKYYLQKDEAYKRKFKYYSTTVVRNLRIGNNAPYFKTMLKRAFYYHKPSLRWKRTMFTAAMRRGFRKKSSTPKKLLYTTNTLTNFSKQNVGIAASFANPDSEKPNIPNIGSEGQSQITLSTGSYSVLGKRASRYRYQIYKDVLQHWYYSPFNRLLLKFDIDSFINRQPKSHFLTKKEERLLHFRRLLLSEHYNSLRWYTYMEHYRTMKSRIGSTKSFSSTVYNQQFQGTFKKIRHLFAITPAQGNMPILQFDQPLYNPQPSNLKIPKSSELSTATDIQKIKSNLLSNHEEITLNSCSGPTCKPLPEDAIEQSLTLAGQYLKQSDMKYGLISRQSLPPLGGQDKPRQQEFGLNTPILLNETSADGASKEVLLVLLKECKRRLNDQAFLKNYISHRLDKRELKYNSVQNDLKKNLESFKTWLSPISINSLIEVSAGGANHTKSKNFDFNQDKLLLQTTGVRKALNEGVFVLNNINPGTSMKSLLTKETANYKYKQQKSYIATLTYLQKEEKIKQTLKSIKSFIQEQNLDNKRGFKRITYASGGQSFFKKCLAILKLQNLTLIKQNNILSTKAQKNLEWWRKKQRVMTKRKASRKKARFKNIKASVEQKAQTAPTFGFAIGNSNQSNSIIPETTLRKKQDNSEKQNLNANFGDRQDQGSSSLSPVLNKISGLESLKTLFLKKFNAKRSSKGSRYRNMSNNRGFAYVRRPKNKSLLDSSSNGTQPTDIQTQSQQESIESIKNLLVKGSIKKSPIQKRSKRTWKKRKRQKFTKNHYKYRKRNIHGFGKLRNLNKKYKRIQATQELQNWWWNIYLPNYLAKNNSFKNNSISFGTKELSYKPLSTNKALEIREKLLKPSPDGLAIVSGEQKVMVSGKTYDPGSSAEQRTIIGSLAGQNPSGLFPTGMDGTLPKQQKNYNTTNIPFYAGWDESLRKFVVTNRLLSRRDTGLRITPTAFGESFNGMEITKNVGENATGSYNNTQSNPEQTKVLLEFTKAPIQGLNEGSFLYLQNEMLFNSYILDQFIPNNQSFYAPLGWKRFQFNHSLLKNWHRTIGQNKSNNKTIFLKNTNLDLFNIKNSTQGAVNRTLTSVQNKNLKILQNRRIKKRYKLLKQTPIQLMYVPTGALLNEILPSHYISVFDKQYRIPRNRYLKRYLPKNIDKGSTEGLNKGKDATSGSFTNSEGLKSSIKDLTLLEYSTNFKNNLAKANSYNAFGKTDSGKNQNIFTDNQSPLDFTLRKKIKPRRKYHKKRFTKKDGLIFPRRQKFSSGPWPIDTNPSFNSTTVGRSVSGEPQSFRLRPSTKAKQNYSTKTKSKKRSPKTLRLRQLRNREFKQVYKPLQRFQPRSGGFVWPGDYLRLETVPMPKFNSLKTGLVPSTEGQSTSGLSGDRVPKSKVKRKINVQPVGILPRKYLLLKHNLKVLKKKLSLSNF